MSTRSWSPSRPRPHRAAADAFFRDPPGEDDPSDEVRLTASALSGLGRDGDQDRVDMLLDKE